MRFFAGDTARAAERFLPRKETVLCRIGKRGSGMDRLRVGRMKWMG
ncbi:MAG: hypothetical protein RSA17_06155 [Ruthenibacterium sp.]